MTDSALERFSSSSNRILFIADLLRTVIQFKISCLPRAFHFTALKFPPKMKKNLRDDPKFQSKTNKKEK